MYEAVIGLEVHLHLKTRTKAFCGCQADYFGAEPNTHVCPICLGLPGTLPVPNRKAVEFGLRLALALGSRVPEKLLFHRKNYFYPDLPKNYQISQYNLPLGEGGALPLGGRKVRIKRLHLEEDAGKSLHLEGRTLLDLNRAGSPLLELVTEPDLTTPEEARLFLQRIQALVQTLGISEASPEEGKLRADVNVSVRRAGEPLGTKVEIKNLNSFKSVQRALEYEIRRQTEILRRGEKVKQATLGFEEGSGKTYPMRTKEEEADYRYFPEPDIPPIPIPRPWVEEIRANLPELPWEKEARYRSLGIKEKDAEVLAYTPSLARFLDRALALGEASPQALANWLLADVAGLLNEQGLTLEETRLTPEGLSRLVALFERGEITSRVAKALLPEVLEGQDPEALVRERGLRVVADEAALKGVVAEVIAAMPEAAESVRQGKLKALDALVGQVMRRTKGQARPDLVRRLLQEALGVG
ncbi:MULTISPECIES: Asp-tRNA(Asn)/Glu-tRNA(Gln) amidotransferase subunit GatB [Thermus]|jgi:aspartyl-tRNA(Asn)/glutamyl-tRNA(Gln) amidotransferase subunit B|uniref:Aspartyl/glutamyl-tRNA(Asn/Gln) amidotransferase subunit B n=1 Tax=Thermus brockianus TaxID=56956 RepID=A0A1J0LRF4_THEBO|nr:Asp-tRNA(Asn)/Glu-tRNA(Gln) amidotransferase subunit GatB [Thermus brockianus]APD08913.1 aspartyl/glutamyl-tRNA amidotransferase subunit B [Thermus brockianus]BDG15660.1 aspartyl/glutamyl-tRNA(Asn/Gln) amidotransferase subunit B [Thermus brockianus]